MDVSTGPRVLGWASRPTSFGPTRSVWRLNQLRHLQGDVAVVSQTPARTRQSTLDLLPTIMGAHLYGHGGLALGRVVDDADLRDYGIGAQILYDLGIHQLRLITNNPRKVAGLDGYGLEISERVPLVMAPGRHNRRYLTTKARKLGHLLQGFHGVLGLDCGQGSSARERGQLLEQIQAMAQAADAVASEEAQTRTRALLGNPDLTVRLTPNAPTVRLGPMLQAMAPQLVAQAALRRLQLLVSPDQQQSGHPRADVPVLHQPWGDWSALAKVDEGAHCLLCWEQPESPEPNPK